MSQTCINLAICIPVANEEATVKRSLVELSGVLDKVKDIKQSQVYLILDNSSVDKTYEIVKDFCDSDSRFELCFYKESKGVVSCYLYGLKKAIANDFDYIIEMDFGGSHPPQHILQIIDKLAIESYDAVFMSRFLPGGSMENLPLYRLLISKYATHLIRFLFKANYTDITSGYKGFKKATLEKVIDYDYAKGSVWQVQMKLLCQKENYTELPYVYLGSTTTFKWRWLAIALYEVLKLKMQNKNSA